MFSYRNVDYLKSIRRRCWSLCKLGKFQCHKQTGNLTEQEIKEITCFNFFLSLVKICFHSLTQIQPFILSFITLQLDERGQNFFSLSPK